MVVLQVSAKKITVLVGVIEIITQFPVVEVVAEEELAILPMASAQAAVVAVVAPEVMEELLCIELNQVIFIGQDLLVEMVELVIKTVLAVALVM